MRDPRPLFAVLAALACLAVAVGCGTDSSVTVSSESAGRSEGAAEGAGTASGEPEGPRGDAGNSSEAGTGAGGGGAGGSGGDAGGSSGDRSSSEATGEGSSGLAPGSGGPTQNDNGARLGADTSEDGDNSIETYGSAVEGSEKAVVLSAMGSFVTAIAERDLTAVCAGLAEKIRAGLGQSGQPCPELLESLLIIPPAEARRAAEGAVSEVRVGGGNAFVLFRPAGGPGDLEYFVMTLEDGTWKSLGLTIGEPVNPAAALPEG